MPLAPRTLVGPYEIVSLLGEGGMGVVYRARDARLRRDVALKVVSAEASGDAARAKQMQHEARAASALNHPNIVSVYDVGTYEGGVYVVTELLEGESLADVVRRGPTPWRAVLALAAQVAEGLAAAHEQGIVHRDIKPDNLFVTHDGRLKILDFGVAQAPRSFERGGTLAEAATVSESSVLVGTVGYMSPEQTRGQAVDARSDLFAFGCVVHELLTGKRAFDGASPIDVLAAIQRDPPAPLEALAPDVPAELARIVERCLDKLPARRFQSARDLGFALSLVEPSRRGQPSADSARRTADAPTTPRPPSAPHDTPRVAAPRLTRRGVFAIGAALVADAVVTALATRALSPRAGAVPQPSAPSPSSAPALAAPLYRQITFQRGTVYTARFTQDGAAIVYSAEWEGRPRELYVTIPGTREARALSQPSTDVAFIPASGDVMTIRRSAGLFSVGVLGRMSLAGGPVKDLVEGVLRADGNADGSILALLRQADSGRVVELGQGHVVARSDRIDDLRLSPDGTRVAYTESVPGVGDRGHVVVVDKGGARIVQSETFASLEGLAWRSDDELWFTAAREGRALWLVAMTLDGATRVLARAPGRLVLHDLFRDGRVIAERNSLRVNLTVGATATGVGSNLALTDSSQLGQLSRDGRQLLFSESASGGAGEVAYLRPTAGGAPLRLGSGVALALSADGARALLSSEGPPPRLEIVPVGAGHTASLSLGALTSVSWAAFLPSGDRVVLRAREPGKPERLFTQSLEGGAPTPIGPADVLVVGDALSPDGTQVAAKVAGRAVTIAIHDGAVEALAGIPDGHAPIGWSADGHEILVRGPEEQSVVLARYALATHALTPWKTLRPADPAGVLAVARISLSRDGEAFACETYQLLSDLFVVENLR